MNKNDDYYDEDGNLIATSWTIKEREREEREEQELLKRELNEERRDINRKIAIEERASSLERKREEDKRKRALRDSWMTMPKWIKSMPRTPLSAPPTEGKKEKALYALTKKVTLTDGERKKREAQLYRLKIAMEDYQSIHRYFPSGTPMAPITVISMGENSGGTIVSRLLSSVIQQSREDLGYVATIDFSGPDSELSSLYGALGKENTRKKVSLRHVIKQIDVLTKARITLLDLFAIGGNNEFYLDNHAEPSRRISVGIHDVVALYKFMRNTDGVCIFDCDLSNIEALMTSAILSNVVIFTLPLDKQTPEKMKNILSLMKQKMKAEDYDRILQNSILVFSATNKSMMDKNNKVKIMKFLNSIKNDNGFYNNVKFIPYDQGIKKFPFKLNNIKFSTAHIFRSIAGEIIDTIIERANNGK